MDNKTDRRTAEFCPDPPALVKGDNSGETKGERQQIKQRGDRT